MTEQEIWIRAWCATAQASNSTSTWICTTYADRCLEAFRLRKFSN